MQLHMDPDFCGWHDPNEPNKRWRMTNEQWWLMTKLVMREMARCGYVGDAPGGVQDPWAIRHDHAGQLIRALRRDPCHIMADVPWGSRIDWRSYARFFACMFGESFGLTTTLALLDAVWATNAALGSPACTVEDEQALVQQIEQNIVGIFGCNCSPGEDLAYISGLSLWGSPVDPTRQDDYAYNHALDALVDEVWADAGGVDDHRYPNGYPGPNHQLAGSAQPPPQAGYQPESPRQFPMYGGLAGKNWEWATNAEGQTTEEGKKASVGNLIFASLLGLAGFGFVAATLAIKAPKAQAVSNPASLKSHLARRRGKSIDPGSGMLAEILRSSEKWEQVLHPDDYQWTLYTRVPIELLNAGTRTDYETEGYEDDEDEEDDEDAMFSTTGLDKYEEILDLYQSSDERWPILVGAGGTSEVLDGNHRLAVMNDMGETVVDVVQALPKKR